MPLLAGFFDSPAEMGLLLCPLAIAAVMGWAGYTIGKPKGRAGLGLFLGLALSVIGLLIIFMLPSKNQPPQG